jgi:hypothetical protein
LKKTECRCGKGSGVEELMKDLTRHETDSRTMLGRRDLKVNEMDSQRTALRESRWEEIPVKALFELEMTSLAPKLSRISVNSSR